MGQEMDEPGLLFSGASCGGAQGVEGPYEKISSSLESTNRQ